MVGFLVGYSVGNKLGLVVGYSVGVLVGASVLSELGGLVGLNEGYNVGPENVGSVVGCHVGKFEVGLPVGKSVGFLVGPEDGYFVVAALGANDEGLDVGPLVLIAVGLEVGA